MLSLPLLTLALQSLLVVASAHGSHHGCGIVPDFFLQMVVDDDDSDPVARQNANYTIQLNAELRAQRLAYSGEGITTDDDDSEFPLEQDPADQQELEDMADAEEAADEDVPDPDSLESRRRVRRSHLGARQQGGLQRFVYNKKQDCNKVTPGTLVRNEYSPTAVDDDINSVFDYFGLVYNFYSQVFGRDSFDDAGGKLHGKVHWCRNWNNAYWTGVDMLFGDGDGLAITKGSFAKTGDVIGHEVTHGVIQSANPLYYYGMSGALNEHLADVFGVISQQWAAGTIAQSSNWQVGKGVLTKNYGPALRDMANPGNAYRNDPQVGNMNDYVNTQADDGGVHINSGIPNRAFYLFATTVGGNAWDTAGTIWYNVLTQGQGKFNYRGETFRGFAEKTYNAALQIYGQDVADQVNDAWSTVGVL